jgi:hypothetical protein
MSERASRDVWLRLIERLAVLLMIAGGLIWLLVPG